MKVAIVDIRDRRYFFYSNNKSKNNSFTLKQKHASIVHCKIKHKYKQI